jgi:hypothetical protein
MLLSRSDREEAVSQERLWQTAGLEKLGWGEDSYDFCWLDCPVPGHLKVHRGREICLCALHAIWLEEHKVRGSYLNVMPPESRAAEWPWRPATPVNVVP